MIISPKEFRNSNPKGFIVFEGVNGCGKSTLMKRLAENLLADDREVICTREPGGTPLGVELRALVQEGKAGKISEKAELFLFAADRAEHVSRVVRPAIESGKIVLSDRYFYSSIAFQGYGRGIDLALISRVCEEAISGLHPDLVVLLDLDPREGLRRIQTQRNLIEDGGADTFEQEKIDFHERLRKGFLEIAHSSPTPFLIIDASKSPDAVFSEALNVIYNNIPLKR